MTLEVIGSGFGRTGTKSLKLALEALGFGPCHHMAEVRNNRTQIDLWLQAARGETVDWDRVFAGYRACVDWPAARFWRELCSRYPAARVIHTVRDVDQWVESMHQTIYPRLRDSKHLDTPEERDRLVMSYELIMKQTFQDRLGDREYAADVFRAHTREVCDAIPAERLLVYDVRQGWEPLCEFLGVPVPQTPFPRVNSTAEYQGKVPKS